MIKYETKDYFYYFAAQINFDRGMQDKINLMRFSDLVIDKNTSALVKCRFDTPRDFLMNSVEKMLKQTWGYEITDKTNVVDWDQITKLVLQYVKQMQSGLEISGIIECGSATIIMKGKTICVRAPRGSGKTKWFMSMVDKSHEILFSESYSKGFCSMTDMVFRITDGAIFASSDKSTLVEVSVLTS